MTAVAIATLVTGAFALTSAVMATTSQRGSTWYQRCAALGGLFAVAWSIAYLMGA